MKNIIKIGIILFTGCTIFISCKNDLDPIKDNLTVREATLSGGNMIIGVKVGTPVQLNLALSPGNRSVTSTSIFSGRHPNIANYSSSGLLTGLMEGKDTLTIRNGDLSVWYIVNVTK